MILLMLVVIVTLPGLSRGNESSASSSDETKARFLINSIRHKDISRAEGKDDVDVDQLMEHISTQREGESQSFISIR